MYYIVERFSIEKTTVPKVLERALLDRICGPTILFETSTICLKRLKAISEHSSQTVVMSRNHGFPKLSRAGCNHTNLCFSPSSHASEVGYQRPSPKQRAAAATPQGHVRARPKGKGERDSIQEEEEGRFPAPLVLPGDDLALDPHYPPQSLRAWIREKNRNKVTPKRRTIYVAAPPAVDQDVEFIRSWSQPRDGACSRAADEGSITSPRMEDILNYLASFYHGLPVKQLPDPNLRYCSWEELPTSPSKPARRKATTRVQSRAYIGLTTSTECIRVRTRSSPSPIYSQQLNLDDLLDAAISILPTDAYALLLLVEHDLFEDEDDEFVCGRAYGGSRVAVVSTARYHPRFDTKQGVERDHCWPASHCEEYLRSWCATSAPSATGTVRHHRSKRSKKTHVHTDSDKRLGMNVMSMPPPGMSAQKPNLALKAAICAHVAVPSLSSSPSVSALGGLWLGRVCKTASHELGHCFGIDHCVYFACVMQGSTSLAEDARQPPYLCPIDEAKLALATGSGLEERRNAMAAFCEERGNVHLWRALWAWLFVNGFSL